ncbi:restriction endonuclease subunit S [Paracoccus kondratievae]|uniref:restriction endonuclease subunit S n=1 Tax=Paracoccus kondratievae TaxID=135740 RepID=UPI00187A9B9D|nr:restriction endonuclease subunit S [Paracoccus kondratievae]
MREPYAKLPLSKVASIERGKFSARPRNDPKYYGGEIPFLQTGDIARAGRVIQGWTQTLNELGLGVSKMFPRGTIFMSIAANIGDVAISGFDAACPDSVVAVKPRNGFDPEWLFQSLKFSKNDLAALSTQNAQANLSLEKIEPFKISVPPLPEQRKIAEILRTWDEALEKLAALRAAKARRLEGLAARLIYDEQTERLHLRDFLSEVSTRNRGQQVERVLSVTNSAGFVLAEDQFAHRVASADLSNYKIVRRGQYAYNPSRINVGSIARLDAWEDGALSPMYVVFQVCDELDSDFFGHWLRSAEARQRIALAAQGSVRETVSFSDLGSILIPVPSIERQRAISRALNAGRDEIALLDAEIEALTRQKRGLMQKLLTGEWRVNTTEVAQ